MSAACASFGQDWAGRSYAVPDGGRRERARRYGAVLEGTATCGSAFPAAVSGGEICADFMHCRGKDGENL